MEAIMEKTKEKKDINKKDKKTEEQKKNLTTKITISKLVSIFILFLIHFCLRLYLYHHNYNC